MEQHELILTTAKDLLIELLRMNDGRKLMLKDGPKAVDDVGQAYTSLVKHVAEAVHSLEH